MKRTAAFMHLNFAHLCTKKMRNYYNTKIDVMLWSLCPSLISVIYAMFQLRNYTDVCSISFSQLICLLVKNVAVNI